MNRQRTLGTALAAATIATAITAFATPATFAAEPSPAPTVQPRVAQTAIKITSKAAQVKVLRKVRGEVLGITPSKRDGFTSWAVKVKRADGSIVTGYVDARSGIIFDWTVQEGPGEPVVDLDGPDRVLEPAKAPAPILVATASPTAAASATGSGPAAQSVQQSSAPHDSTPSPTASPSASSGHDDAHDEAHHAAEPSATSSAQATESRHDDDSHDGDSHHATPAPSASSSSTRDARDDDDDHHRDGTGTSDHADDH